MTSGSHAIDSSSYSISSFTSSLADQMKEATQVLHAKAESNVFIKQLVAKQVSRRAYVQYLVNLKPIYEALENTLEKNKDDKRLASIVIPALYRTEKIKNDLEFFGALNSKPSEDAEKHANRIKEIGEQSPHLLIAHVYARFLGDLHGGQVLGRVVKELWGEEASNFYSYAELQGSPDYKAEVLSIFARNYYRAWINKLPLTPKEIQEVVEESVKAFELSDEMIKNLPPSAML